MKKIVFASLFMLPLTACIAVDSGVSFRAVSAPGLTSPFTEHCQSIRIERSYAGTKDLMGTLSASNTGIVLLGAPSTPYTVIATCLDGAGKTTGSTTRALTTYHTEVGSGEGSSIQASYAQHYQTEGIFPILMPK